MKAYTSLEQSQKLARILPLESADMFWPNAPITVPCIKDGNPMGVNIPCWSLAALLTTLSFPNLFENDGWNLYTTIDEKLFSINNADNPVDVCVDMVIKLHEQKLL